MVKLSRIRDNINQYRFWKGPFEFKIYGSLQKKSQESLIILCSFQFSRFFIIFTGAHNIAMLAMDNDNYEVVVPKRITFFAIGAAIIFFP